MVYKIFWTLICSLLLQQTNPVWADNSNDPQKLAFSWITTEKVNSSNCIHLVEVFLSELRNIALDHIIELAATNKAAPSNNSILLTCTGSETLEVGRKEGSALTMRFQSLSESYDSLDWVAFQKQFLDPEEPSLAALAPASTPENSSPTATENKSVLEQNSSHSSLFKKWWFWTIVGGAAIGAYAASQALSHNQGMSVEIR